MDNKLSEHLTLGEMTRSNTAKRLGIDNSPTEVHYSNMRMLAEKIFEPIREHFGVPIYVSSGYRSKNLNRAIGGSQTSAHCHGLAIDIDMDDRGSSVTNRQVFDWIKDNLSVDQLIAEYPSNGKPAWVHVGINLDYPNRNEILVAKKIKGKTVYSKYESEKDLQ